MSKLMVIDSEAYWVLISLIPTSAKRMTARNKAKKLTVGKIDDLIYEKKDILRSLRSESDSVKRGVYAEISKLEQKKLDFLENA